MLKTKSELFETFKRFKALVEVRDERKIKTFRMDRGGEFCSREFLNYCEENGINRNFTAPYSPQQNGVVERHNRTMIEMARSLLKEMNMPSQFWGEAIRHAIYFLNRLPTRAVSGVTPFEACSGEKPYVGHIHAFGCVAHMRIPTVNMKKLDDRSKAVVHLGKEPGTKAYRLYDPVSKKVHVSRDVIFEEKKSWAWAHEFEIEIADEEKFVVLGLGIDTKQNNENVEESGYISNSDASIESSHATNSSSTESGTSSSSTPKNYKSLAEVYDNAEHVELDDDELFLVAADEPENYTQASKNHLWKQAMEREIESVEQNKTWSLTALPSGHKAINLKWVFKLKRDAAGNIVKHKARIVAKGYVQRKGVDFEEIFAPVTRLETVHLLLAHAA